MNKFALEMLKCFFGVKGRAKRGLWAPQTEQLAGGSALVLVGPSTGGRWSHLQTCLCLELFSRCWGGVTLSQVSFCWGRQLSANPVAQRMTPYHWALMINQQTNYNSRSRVSVAFMSGRVKAEKWDLVCRKHELFPTLPAARWHWRRF